MVDYPPLPGWVNVDRLQLQEEVAGELRSLYQKYRIVLLQAPTGSGKTLIANLTQRKLQAPRMVYTCTTKSLQDQVVRDFVAGKVLKGRVNYPTLLGEVDELGMVSDDYVTAADCTWNGEFCVWCDEARPDCPYVIARDDAVNAQLAILNTSYLLTDYHGPKRFTFREFNVIDEADKVEGELLNHAELRISPSRMRTLNLNPPKYRTKADTWQGWLEDDAIPRAKDYLFSLPALSQTNDVEVIREIRFMENLFDRLNLVADQMSDSRWVYGGYKEDDDNVIFQPVFIDTMGQHLMWNNGLRFLLMSATILSPDVMATELGIPKGEYGFLEMPSDFPVENRPVYFVPIADMSRDMIEMETPTMARGITAILNRHPNDRTLIHTVSYKLARGLKDWLKMRPRPPTELSRRPILTYDNSREREYALDQFKDTPGAVLLAPNMDRGIDLPDDLCRAQVIAKIPFPNLGDVRVNARLYSSGGNSWYAAQTIGTIVQMVGRAVRHKGDHAVTYICDKQFGNIWGKYSLMFPKYFRESLLFNLNPRTLLRGE